jgi:predicted dehydrogenase
MTQTNATGNGRVNRRSFLKTTAAAAGTALAADALMPQLYAAGSDMIKVGVIGCGGRGTGAAENVLHSAKGVQVVAVADAFEKQAKGCRQHLLNLADSPEVKDKGNGVDLPEERCFAGLDAYEKVINAPGVNYIILATPPGFRPLHLQAAVAAGKTIFTEKPVGVDGPGIRKVLAACEEAQKKKLSIAAGTQRRHQAGYIETIKRIHDGEIGDVRALRCYWNGGGIWFRKREEMTGFSEKITDLAYQLWNWYHFLWVCGDHIVEQHVHNLDVCNWVMKAHPVRAVGMGSRSARPQGDPNVVGHIFDNFAIDYEYGNGVHMLSMCRQIANCENSVSEAVMGSKGFCQVNAYTINGRRVAGRRETNPYVQEHTDLIEAVRSGKPFNELKNVAESSLTAVMGRMSAYTGQAVSWEQALNSKQDTFPANLTWDMPLSVSPTPVPGKTRLI